MFWSAHRVRTAVKINTGLAETVEGALTNQGD